MELEPKKILPDLFFDISKFVDGHDFETKCNVLNVNLVTRFYMRTVFHIIDS